MNVRRRSELHTVQGTRDTAGASAARGTFGRVVSSSSVTYPCMIHEMDAPMSDWFRSIPYGLDAIAYAAKVRALL